MLGGALGSEPPADIYELRYSMNDLNKEIWRSRTVAAASATVKGKDNFLFYKGKAADLVYWEVRDMGHREPPMRLKPSGANVLRLINENGKHIHRRRSPYR